MKKKVILSDGLGNQLFQVSFAYFLIQSGYKVELDRFKIKSGDAAITDFYDIKITVKDSKIKRLVFKLNLILKFKFKSNFNIPKSKNTFVQKTPFDVQIDYNKKIFEGYFQNKKYIQLCQDHIQHLVPFDTSIFFKEFVNRITEKSCAIHFRGGDYKSAGFHILGSSYYSKAIIEMDNLGIDEYYIFSSDDKFAKSIIDGINSNSKFMFFKHPNQLDYEELYIMSKFKNIIIANSTFSLWSAYMGRNKKVICPSRWINHEFNPENTLYLENWKIL
jgi:hypothetical protein